MKPGALSTQCILNLKRFIFYWKRWCSTGSMSDGIVNNFFFHSVFCSSFFWGQVQTNMSIYSFLSIFDFSMNLLGFFLRFVDVKMYFVVCYVFIVTFDQNHTQYTSNICYGVTDNGLDIFSRSDRRSVPYCSNQLRNYLLPY